MSNSIVLRKVHKSSTRDLLFIRDHYSIARLNLLQNVIAVVENLISSFVSYLIQSHICFAICFEYLMNFRHYYSNQIV
jgi:hypothetical protein